MANNGNLREPWKKGQSGNPKGKPKGAKNISTYLRELLEVKTNTTSGLKETSAVIASKMIQAAIRGDRHMIREILDRTEGKVGDQVGTEGKDVGVIVLGQQDDY